MSARSFAAIFCASLAVATVLRFAAHQNEQALSIRRVGQLPKPPEPPLRPRKVYAYSVIPGGAYSGEELALARRVDRVVAAHYADFEPAGTTVRPLPADTYLYVSYRKGDRVYWTANKRRIPKGEMVLCDGAHLARTRCGNRLSAAPQFPIAPGPPPTEAALNAPELPPGLELPGAPLFVPRYDAPAMPLLDARDRLFAFPTGSTGASPLGAFLPLGGAWSPMMGVASLPFHTSGTTGGPGGSVSGPIPGGGGPTGPTGGGGPIPGATVPEPASAALAVAGIALLLLHCRRIRRSQRTIPGKQCCVTDIQSAG